MAACRICMVDLASRPCPPCLQITNGRFTVDGVSYQTLINEPAGPDTLHGGPIGFDRRLWTVKHKAHDAITFFHVDGDGEMVRSGQDAVHPCLC